MQASAAKWLASPSTKSVGGNQPMQTGSETVARVESASPTNEWSSRGVTAPDEGLGQAWQQAWSKLSGRGDSGQRSQDGGFEPGRPVRSVVEFQNEGIDTCGGSQECLPASRRISSRLLYGVAARATVV